ncbi:TetR family transcriptional regulator [Sphaerisporangium siamense]|uniref:AcrR family transcriptional regulator n=1 Tax=Sphaerisporangium siamense TaxID=795645 RepID=A0A7W7DDZ5_9ACTN|nr:TetR family transcriptional regulator [Sphaerisporangium siamense]MBB4705072.1 AcrR family transcriptional regulator [Sphaerisporangium siamense]GII83878.1 TetR family transcriptional regulator [Sphaerisporangium siamense]
MTEGLRERKKRRTKEAIREAAMRLFMERGFDAVTVAEVAAAAEVAKVTLFKYFPTKESLILESAAADDPTPIVAARPPGVTPVGALRAHYRAFAADPGSQPALGSEGAVIQWMRVIMDSPVLLAGMHRLLDEQRDRLARLLAAEAGAAPGDLTPSLVAAQITGTILMLKAGFFRFLVDGGSLADAGAYLAGAVEHAFDLLENGVGHLYPR